MASSPALMLERALAEQRRSNWSVAQRFYEAATAAAPGTPQIHHNLALCLYAQGSHRAAFEHAELATRRAPQLVQAWVLRAKIERALGEVGSSAQSLHTALDISPRQPQAVLELANLTLNELGDACEAQSLVKPLLGDPEHAEDAQLTTLMAKLYDRVESAEEYTQQVIAFADRYLKLRDFRFTVKKRRRAEGKKAAKRVGLLSPLFCASPVYFFTIGALSLLAEELDLVVFNRGTKSDWATDKFRAIAREWHDVAHLPAAALANAINAQSLDVLFDMGGWTDAVGLKALSTKPARRMYKWVGGQSCTTGLDVFDGFISDRYQTPDGTAHLYTEPLLLLQSGYVSYTPPEYLPAPRSAISARPTYGIISNPVKISAAFLRDMRSMCGELLANGGTLRFIDRRYRHSQVRDRILRGLGQLQPEKPAIDMGRIQFLAPDSHREYLAHIAGLDKAYDTCPYSGGLTTIEALSLGVTCATRAGRLFCERHSFSHFGFTGLGLKGQTVKRGGEWVAFGRPVEHSGLALAARSAHGALAENLLRATMASEGLH